MQETLSRMKRGKNTAVDKWQKKERSTGREKEGEHCNIARLPM
jgi:hypothetical protein